MKNYMKRKQIRLKQPNISGLLLFKHSANFSELHRKLYWHLRYEVFMDIKRG